MECNVSVNVSMCVSKVSQNRHCAQLPGCPEPPRALCLVSGGRMMSTWELHSKTAPDLKLRDPYPKGPPNPEKQKLLYKA